VYRSTQNRSEYLYIYNVPTWEVLVSVYHGDLDETCLDLVMEYSFRDRRHALQEAADVVDEGLTTVHLRLLFDPVDTLAIFLEVTASLRSLGNCTGSRAVIEAGAFRTNFELLLLRVAQCSHLRGHLGGRVLRW